MTYKWLEGDKQVAYMWLDLRVDSNKSTPVDLGVSSRVGSIALGAVDPSVEFKKESDFTPIFLKSTWTDFII